MPRPRFSEALVARRHELGLSVSQASKILKLREDVLIAFEEGDYDHMPQSGYAQGMLSSYARYLGLNAREIVDLFQEELYEFRHGTSSHELRRRTRQTQSGRGVSGYDLVNEAGSRPKAYVEYRPLLPTSGGPAGDMGDFATSSPARPRTSVPLVGSSYGTAASGGGYGLPQASSDEYDHLSPGRRYNSAPERSTASPSTARRRSTGRRRRDDDQASRLISEGQRSYGSRGGDRSLEPTARLYRRDDVSTRRVSPSEYTDDLRLDDRANPYAPASTISGRRSSRNIANIERPNVRRRQPQGGRPHGSGRRGGGRGGALGFVGTFLSDPRRALLALILLLAIVLTCILTFSVSSCVSGRTQTPPAGQVVSVDTTGEQGDGTDASDDASDDSQGEGEATPDEQSGDDAAAQDGSQEGQDPSEGDSSSDADAAAGDEESPDDEKDQEPKETVVEVSVASGQVSWVEITCDGTSDVAESVTGPWSQSYTVHDSITIQVASPEFVTVTENGERREFSSHAGGLGSLTIEGTPLPEEEGDAADGSADAASQDDGSGAE